MTQEEKQLLLKVLCEQLPYDVKAKVFSYWNDEYYDQTIWGLDIENNNVLCNVPGECCEIDLIKPYLRPMSSMTEEEKKELWAALDKDMSILDSIFDAPIINEYKSRVYRGNPVHYELDFLISHHFDYRGLIPMGLALEAPEGMYKID